MPLAWLSMILALASVGVVRAAPPAPAAAALPDRAAYAEGSAHYQADRFVEAATAFHRAFQLAPRPVYLFNAARSEHRALKLKDAERDYLRTLELPEVPADMRSRISVHLDEIRTTRGKVGTSVSAGPTHPWRPLGIVTTAVGGVSVVVGAVLLGVALSDDQALSASIEKRDTAGRVTDLDYARYDATRTGIERNHTLGHVLLWSGAVAATAGAWLSISTSDDSKDLRMSLSLNDRGLGLRGSF